ncbi:MAG TPA: tetratricopeptide repeat protein, partial [Candidatus Angelobacter sp.]|nr:tetratricopeptide repeat protein [Candidatus Angelobacter sp.]
ALFLQPKYGDAIILLAGLNISSGDTGQAISALKQVIKDQPGMTQAYLLLGTACTAQKNFDQALAAYSKLAELNPKNAQAPLLMGTVLLQKKDTAGARREFEKALQLSPSFLLAEESLVNLDIREEKFTSALDRLNKETDQKLGAGREILLAKVYINRAESVARKGAHSNAPDIKLTSPVVQDDVNHAEAALQKAIALEPMQDVPYLILAQLYISAGKQQVALEHLNSFVAKTNDAAAFMEMGSIYEKMKDFPKARDAYEKVIALKPGFGGALNNLAYLYATRLDDVDKGYPLAEKAYQASPTASTADTLGWILVKKGEYPRARALLEDSASKLSGNPEVQLHLGMVRYMMGDEGPARAALQEAANSTEDFPSKDEAAKALAILAIDPKTADAKVQADLEKTLQDEPNDPVAATRLAGIYEREGNLDKAQTTYEQLIKQNPQNGPVLGRLAGIYLRLNQIDRAMDTAKQAHKLSPNDPSISSVLGRIAFKTGDYNFAATLLQEAAPRLTGRPEVQYDLAWSYYSLGRVNDAERTMQGAAPTLTGARQADAQLFLTLLAAAQTPTAAATARAAQVLGTNADYVPAIMISAMEAEKQAKPDDAMRLYGKALARYPSFLPAARNLTILAAQHPGGDDQNAYDAGMKARAVYSDDVNLERALGLLAYRRADYPRAVQLLTETSQTLNNDGEVFFYLGMAQYQMKHLPQSKVALQRALALDPKSKSADDARKVLAELK